MTRKELLIILLISFISVSLTTPGIAENSSDIPGPSEFEPVTMEELLSNRDEYDQKRVKLEGTVEEVKYTKSGKGEPFTLFKLKDQNDNEVRVYYEDEHLPLSTGDRVEIMGRYKKKKSYFLKSFKNVIKARYVNELSGQ